MLNVIKFEVDFQVKWLSATKQTLNIYFDLLSNKKLASRSLMLEQNPRDGRKKSRCQLLHLLMAAAGQ